MANPECARGGGINHILAEKRGVSLTFFLKMHENVIFSLIKGEGGVRRLRAMLDPPLTYLDRQNLALLYKALVRPLLEYGNLVWSPYLKGDIGKLEAVQHLATRIIPSLKELLYQEMVKLLKLPSLRYSRTRGEMIKTYKYLHGINKVLTHFFPLSED